MRVNGENISNEELVELTEQVRPIADSMEDKPTEFELITAIAFLYFKRHHCDVVVLEVGLGGRLDSTNIIQAPILSVITGIDFDHTDLLGDTLEAIAAEKGGIIKSGCPVLYGGSDASVYQTLKNISDVQGARLYTVDPTRLSVISMTVDGTVMDFGEWKELKLPLLGTYQPQNAVNVLSAIELLNATGKWNIPESAVRTGLASVKWHARFEKLKESPLVFFDGSHNPQGIASAVNTIQTYFPDQKVDILTGVMRDKNFEVMIDCISQVADRVFTVTPANPRALPAEEYAAHFRSHGVDASAYPTVNEGVKAAVSHARNTNAPLICLGSLYLYGELADLIQEEP
jgi:dihydrofolate synthase/folylpolyglutamate synthase